MPNSFGGFYQELCEIGYNSLKRSLSNFNKREVRSSIVNSCYELWKLARPISQGMDQLSSKLSNLRRWQQHQYLAHEVFLEMIYTLSLFVLLQALFFVWYLPKQPFILLESE
jgi:hypothetical protein